MPSIARYWWVAAIVALILVGISGMNSIAPLQEQVNAAWAQVENQYQRRLDLIPNLVETVKGAANFEQKTLTDVIDARAKATQVTLTPEMLNDPEAVKKFGAGRGGIVPVAASGGIGKLSRPESEPEFPRVAVADRGHRKPHRRGAPRLYRRRAGLQYPRAYLPRRAMGAHSGRATQGGIHRQRRC
jgi:hypothetical protein